MKTFKDLEFHTHEVDINGLHSEMHFKNGFGISVIKGSNFYCGDNTYEVAMLRNGNFTANIFTGDNDSILGYQTPEEITELMRVLQEKK